MPRCNLQLSGSTQSPTGGDTMTFEVLREFEDVLYVFRLAHEPTMWESRVIRMVYSEEVRPSSWRELKTADASLLC